MSTESFEPATRVTEERTVVSSLDDSAPVKDTASTTTSTTTAVPSTTSSIPTTTSHSTTTTSSHPNTDTTSPIPSSTSSYPSLHTHDESTPAPGTTSQAATNLGIAATNVAASALQGAKNLAGALYERAPPAEDVKNLGLTAGGVVYDNAPSREQVKGAGQAVGNTAVNTGAAVGNKAAEMAPSGEQVRNAGSAVGSTAYNAGAAVGNTAANASSAAANTTYNAGAAVGNTAYNTGAAVGSGAYSAGAVVGNTAANAATYIKDTVTSYIPETVKDYLPTAVVGSTAPSTTLPTSELGQNTTPQTHSATGPLPGPPGEKDVAVLPDEKLYSQSSLPSVTDSSVPSSHKTSHTLPSQEGSHTPSTHHAVGPLPSGEGVAVLPSARTHDLATTGGVADLAGDSVAKLPGERELAAKEGMPTRDDVGRTKSGVESNKFGGATATGVGALPGYMGESGVAGVENLQGAPKSGADSQASTRTLAGSIAPSTTTSGSGFDSSTHPSTATNPSITSTATQPSTTSHPTTGTNPFKTSTQTDKPRDTPQRGTMDKAKETFASMQTGAKQTEEKAASKVPGTQAHKKEKKQSVGTVDTPMSTRATTGHSTPPASSSAGERLATASAGAAGAGVGTGAYPLTSTTGGPVAGQHPDMPTSPSGPHTGRHAGATEPRFTDSATTANKDVRDKDTKDTSKGGKEKVSLKDKIKGEAKVISGKIGGNEEKVEVGKRMMGKN